MERSSMSTVNVEFGGISCTWFAPYAYSGGTMSLLNCPGPIPLMPSFNAGRNGPPGVPLGTPTVNP